MIDQLATHCCQHLGALYHIRDYVPWSDWYHHCFQVLSVQPVCEYGDVIFMGTSVTFLCQVTFPLLLCRGLLCKLLDSQCQGSLQNFCPYLSLSHTLITCDMLATDDPLSLQVLTWVQLSGFIYQKFFGGHSFHLGFTPIDFTYMKEVPWRDGSQFATYCRDTLLYDV